MKHYLLRPHHLWAVVVTAAAIGFLLALSLVHL
jgi:hypothetical protein